VATVASVLCPAHEMVRTVVPVSQPEDEVGL
jgi:hypothetical protein